MKKNIAERLKEKGISHTPVRQLIYSCLENASTPLSLSEIELRLETVDKSSISRTLNLFREKHIVHYFDDGSGSVKYEMCNSHHHDQDDDTHVHFHCSKCGETICLNHIKIPKVDIPDGFLIENINYVITGRCLKCR